MSTPIEQLGFAAQLFVMSVPYAVIMLVFCFVFLVTLTLSQHIARREEIRKRAFAFDAPQSYDTPVYDHAMADLSASRQHHRAHTPEIEALITRTLALQSSEHNANIGADLIKAGFYNKSAIYYYFAARIGTAIGLPTLILLVLQAANISLPSIVLVSLILGGAVVGLISPSIYLDMRRRKVRRLNSYAFPDFLDLLVVCSEAGMTPRAAIDRVARELAHDHPHLSANLYLMSLELRAGRPLVEAAQNLGERVEVEEVKSLGRLLKQTEELGTSLNDALRVYSEDMRDKRMSRAEEKAHALPVKLVIPLALYVFPVVLIVIMLPLVIRIHGAMS